ncbi:MAG: MmcB family DNA repair protein, partial [Pseudomonadota bacterium]
MQTTFDMQHPLSPGAEQIAIGTLRLLDDHGFAGVTEMTLANGRRADIAALGAGGEISIIEIKSCLN